MILVKGDMRTNNPAEQRSEFASLLSSQTTNIRIDSQTTNIRIDSQTTNIRIDLQTTTNIRILALRELLEDRINHTSHMSVPFAKLIKMKLRNATKVLAADNLSTFQLITKIIPEKHIVLGNKLPGQIFSSHVSCEFHNSWRNRIAKFLKLCTNKLNWHIFCVVITHDHEH